MVNLKDKVKKLTVIYICFFAICALFYFVAGDQIQTKEVFHLRSYQMEL